MAHSAAALQLYFFSFNSYLCSERGPQHTGFPVSLRPHQVVDTSPAPHGVGTIGVLTRPLSYLPKQRLLPTAYRSLNGTMIYPPGLLRIQLTGPLVPSTISISLCPTSNRGPLGCPQGQVETSDCWGSPFNHRHFSPGHPRHSLCQTSHRN